GWRGGFWRCRTPAGALPNQSSAFDRANDNVEGDREHQDDNNGREDARTVENGAVDGHQVADAAGRGEHFRYDDADDGQGAAESEAGKHGRDRGRDDDAGDQLRQRRAHAAGGQQILLVDGTDTGGGRQHYR